MLRVRREQRPGAPTEKLPYLVIGHRRNKGVDVCRLPAIEELAQPQLAGRRSSSLG